MRRTLAVIENDMYVRNFVASGAFRACLRDEGFRVATSEIVTRTGAIPPGRHAGSYERIRENIAAIARFNKLSMHALRDRSATFAVKATTGWMGAYSPAELTEVREEGIEGLRAGCTSSLAPNPSLEALVRREEPEIVVFPITGVEATGWELVQLSERYGFTTFFLINGWDNLSSKGVFPLLPDYLGVFGPSQVAECARIQSMPAHRTFSLGCARYEAYLEARSAATAAASPFPHPYILFAGGTAKADEITPLRHLDEVLAQLGEEGLKVVYRPHPWREPRACFDVFRHEEFRHVVMDPQVGAAYYREKARGTESTSSQNYPDLEYGPGLLQHARFVVSPSSSMTLEAALFDVPSIVLAHDDGVHPMGPDRTAAFEHVKGARAVPGWFFVDSLDELDWTFPELVIRLRDEAPSKRTFRPALAAAMRRYLHDDGRSYADRLAEALHVLSATLDEGVRPGSSASLDVVPSRLGVS